MNIREVKPKENENKYEFLWRVGEMKTNKTADGSWDDVQAVMNKNFEADEKDYKTSSAYRKTYQCAKMFVGKALVPKEIEVPEDMLKELERERREIEKERIRLRDERTQMKKYIRDETRFEDRLDFLEGLITDEGVKKYGNLELCEFNGFDDNKELLVLLGDWHIGLAFDNEFGHYNSDIAKKRIETLLNETVKIGLRHNCHVVNVALLGDMISGAIHKTVQIQNREDVIEQIMIASEMVSDFCAKLCQVFDEVNFVSVAGNHSRIEANKEMAVKDERLDDLIGLFVKNYLSCIENFNPIKETDNTVAELGIAGRLYCFTHGDLGGLNQNEVGKLAFMLGDIPKVICTGHMHRFEMNDINGVVCVRNGSLCGTGDDYTVEKRLNGCASQTVLVCGENGIECAYPVSLEIK